MIRRMGVEFRTGTPIESAEALEELESEFDFIFLGVGLGAMQRMNIPGEDQKGVLNALGVYRVLQGSTLSRTERDGGCGRCWKHGD